MSLVENAAYVAGTGLALVALVGLKRALRGSPRATGKALTAWAKSVKFSTQQLTAMRSLWHWYRTKKQPAADPLKLLSTADVADLLKKCSLDYKPERLRAPNEEKARQRFGAELGQLGMDDIHAQVVVGMRYGQLGPATDGGR
ncbi:MAG: hypothetical protein K1X79_04340 [Oligoflexia bacterium]|nr:hypothetical protein [Oligoflexia bacterium]